MVHIISNAAGLAIFRGDDLRAAAEAEAERLAKTQPDDAFDVFVSVCRKRAEVTQQVVVKTTEPRSHA